ncbi:MAG TPA: efflux RND transporter periplasmic adaptor subunit [Candidatus Obscuribacterales bacterium]
MPYQLQRMLFKFTLSVTTFFSLILMSPVVVFAHAGHGSHEFENNGEATTSLSGITVDPQTLQRLGIKTKPVSRELMDIGIKTTGQIETLPNKTVEITAPIPGQVVQLLVEPGDRVEKAEIVAIISSSELVSLRVDSLQNQSQAKATLKETQANLELAQQNYQRLINISNSEIAEAKNQLQAAQSRYERDKNIVDNKSVISINQENYQRQVKIAEAEIQQAEIEQEVAQEQYARDQELMESGALPRRTFLESKAHLAAAQSALARAEGRRNVLTAQTEVKQAEIDLPIRDLRESETLLSQAQAQLVKAQQRREVIEAEAELKRAKSAVEAAKSGLNLSDVSYQTRLRQLGIGADQDGTVTVISPIAGVVSHRDITLGQSINEAGQSLMKIQDHSQVWATANLYEKDISQVKMGQRVQVRVASLNNQIFEGKVAQISPLVEGETRVIPVRVELDNQEGKLKPGMFAELELITNQTTTPLLSIPTNAVVDGNGKSLVYVQNGQSFTPIEVSLGKTFANRVEVEKGLFEGDSIVIEGAIQLYAQSLRGNNKKVEEAESTTVQAQIMAVDLPSNLLQWLIIPGMGAIAFTAYWLGRKTQFQSEQKIEQKSDRLPRSETAEVEI